MIDLAEARARFEQSFGGEIVDEMVRIEVIDRGHGFDGSETGHADAHHGAESGRGIQLMRSLVDRLEFQNRPTEGTVVHLEKRLAWGPDAPIAQLDSR